MTDLGGILMGMRYKQIISSKQVWKKALGVGYMGIRLTSSNLKPSQILGQGKGIEARLLPSLNALCLPKLNTWR